ncbi:MAG: trypsin-like peptidase domain-containing protein [Armatimonadetes bacterium]|nr:trypsin-like peptidase domain-containing protein [Armatimonadota bacterium]
MDSILSIKNAVLIFAVVFGSVLSALLVNNVMVSKTGAVTDSRGYSGLESASYDGLEAPFDFRAAARRVMPSVVTIDSAIELDSFMSGNPIVQPTGSGSGVVMSANGYIVTNAHVIRNPNRKGSAVAADQVRVRTSDGRGFDAEVIGIDPISDLAVIKVDAQNLIPSVFGDSDEVEIGEWVFAIGNPLGFENTLSVGVVSSKGRWLETKEGSIILNSIQTDAAINKGNSGGPLCNTKGEVIGINSVLAESNGAPVGIGFAIPSNHVQRVFADIQTYGHVRYGVPGFYFGQYQPSLAAPSNRLRILRLTNASSEPPNYGLVIRQVDPGSPAATAGLGGLDIVMEIDGNRIERYRDYIRLMIEKRPGDKVEFLIWSAGEKKTITLVMAEYNP